MKPAVPILLSLVLHMKWLWNSNYYYYYAAIEEEYGTFLIKKEEKDDTLKDTEAQLTGLIKKVETYAQRLRDIETREKEAQEIVQSYPNLISRLQDKINSTEQLLGPSP